MRGGDGDDILIGGTGDDIMSGDVGNDSLDGGLGNDQLNGNDGDDTLNGGPGDDVIIGGKGNNSISGGTGFDTLKARASQTLRQGQRRNNGELNDKYQGYMNKFYDADGGDAILSGYGQNEFYFTGPSELGFTLIDILTQYDKLIFYNACNVATTVILGEHEVSDTIDLSSYEGEWLVFINEDSTEAGLCMNDPVEQEVGTCWYFDLPDCEI